jgi:hypothetical protein
VNPFLGLDLGQARDYTAIAIVERLANKPFHEERENAPRTHRRYHLPVTTACFVIAAPLPRSCYILPLVDITCQHLWRLSAKYRAFLRRVVLSCEVGSTGGTDWRAGGL